MSMTQPPPTPTTHPTHTEAVADAAASGFKGANVKDIIGYVVVDRTTKAIDWDGEMHSSREEALESMCNIRQMYARTPDEANEEKVYWADHYEILTVHRDSHDKGTTASESTDILLEDTDPATVFHVRLSVTDAVDVIEDGLRNDAMEDLNTLAFNIYGLLIDADRVGRHQ